MSAAVRTAVIVNAKGLHARASRLFVTTAAQFDAQVTVRRDGIEVNADSVLSLLECAAGPGAQIEIAAQGPEAEQAADALAELVAAGFHEDDG